MVKLKSIHKLLRMLAGRFSRKLLKKELLIALPSTLIVGDLTKTWGRLGLQTTLQS